MKEGGQRVFLIIALMLSISSSSLALVDGGRKSQASGGGAACFGPALPSPRDPRPDARAAMKTLVVGVQHIERIRGKTLGDAGDRNCVEAKLAEARVGLQIATGEMERLESSMGPCPDAGEQAYAMRRLKLLVERADELNKAARVCATENLSSIDTTTVEVEISPSIPAHDPTHVPMPGQGIQLRWPF
jgi:hypothetical protein